VFREDILAHAYRVSRASKGARTPGVDGATFEDIEAAGREEWLAGVRRTLQDKTYRPAPVTVTLHGHAAGNGGYGQEKPTAAPDLSYSARLPKSNALSSQFMYKSGMLPCERSVGGFASCGKSKGWTQETLAGRAGLDRSYVARESRQGCGIPRPGAREARASARRAALGVVPRCNVVLIIPRDTGLSLKWYNFYT
jgi:hypothetical protein